MKLFATEDFEVPGVIQSGSCTTRYAADIANAKLAEMLAVAHVMFCRRDSMGLWAADECPYFARATHTAKLICIEELKK